MINSKQKKRDKAFLSPHALHGVFLFAFFKAFFYTKNRKNPHYFEKN